MKPVAVIPMNDPEGKYFPHLRAIYPQLRRIFARMYTCVNPSTQKALPDQIAWLTADDFFVVNQYVESRSVGTEFTELFSRAAAECPPEQVLHLCFIDRVAFALQTAHQAAFIADIQQLLPAATPRIFQRSEQAWETHPDNYRQIEQFVTYVGQLLLGRSLDFAWCHMAVQAQHLLEALATVRSEDLSFFAELVLALPPKIHMQAVDWLAWEDPFFTGDDPAALKAAREMSVAETHKRLGYAIPMLQHIQAASLE